MNSESRVTVFVDTNILLDVLTQPDPFYNDSAAIWDMAERGVLSGLISAISFNNIYYVVRRLSDKDRADEAICILRDVFQPVALTPQILNQAIDAGFSDFEDAILYHSAIHGMAECILTRNVNHFPRDASIPVLTPAEYLASL